MGQGGLMSAKEADRYAVTDPMVPIRDSVVCPPAMTVVSTALLRLDVVAPDDLFIPLEFSFHPLPKRRAGQGHDFGSHVV